MKRLSSHTPSSHATFPPHLVPFSPSTPLSRLCSPSPSHCPSHCPSLCPGPFPRPLPLPLCFLSLPLNLHLLPPLSPSALSTSMFVTPPAPHHHHQPTPQLTGKNRFQKRGGGGERGRARVTVHAKHHLHFAALVDKGRRRVLERQRERGIGKGRDGDREREGGRETGRDGT